MAPSMAPLSAQGRKQAGRPSGNTEPLMKSNHMKSEKMLNSYWWLATDEIRPKLIDGPHDDPEGCEQALYIMKKLNLARKEKYIKCKIETYSVEPKPHNVNEEKLNYLQNSIYKTPKSE